MRTRIIPLVVLFSALLFCGAPRLVHAYRLTGLGASLGLTAPEDLDGAVDVGGHMEFERPASRLHLVPGFRYWRVNGVSDLQLDGDAAYHFLPEAAASPYLGAGLGLHLIDRSDGSSTSLGPNLLGGFRFPSGTGYGFVEARASLADVSQFSVLGGMTWRVR